jgi:hypothetical protein
MWKWERELKAESSKLKVVETEGCGQKTDDAGQRLEIEMRN